MRIRSNHNYKRYNFLILILLFAVVFFNNETVSACTIFSASNGEKVLFGNNEDYLNLTLWGRFEQPKEVFKHYGVFYLGHSLTSSPQGGMNEKGLCFDGNALPEMELTYNYSKKHYSGNLFDMLMKKCANVSEVIEVAKEYSWGTSMACQAIFADVTGDAVVISPGTDGNINFTRKTEQDGFLISTNFNRGYPESGQYPCWRYDTAYSMLSDELRSKEDLTIDLFRSILNTTHVEGSRVNTIYSNIFDPSNRMIYLYYWHQFDEVVKLNLTEELAKSDIDRQIVLTDLFSQEVQDKAKTEHEYYLNKADSSDGFSLCVSIEQPLFPIAILVIIGALILYRKSQGR